MPVRSITLKLIVPRKSPGLPEARALWTTHDVVNRAVAYYESILLEMRGQEYLLPGDELVPAGDVASRMDERIREACAANGRKGNLAATRLAEIRGLYRQLYEAIVPSSIGEKGDAQAANAFLSPLTDPDSKGFLSVFDKIGSPPSWLEGVRNNDPAAFAAAEAWKETPDGKLRLAGTGAPPGWVKKCRAGDASWPLAFVQDYDKKLKEIEGVPAIIKALKDAGALPLFVPSVTPLLVESRSALSPWDRLAFRLAVAHLLSWESWCRLAADEHRKRAERMEAFRNTHLADETLAPAFAALARYQEERTEELSTLGLPLTGPFRIKARMVRAWPELREKWLKEKDPAPARLMGIAAEMQTKLRGGFGDPHLFSWLARSDNQLVWQCGRDPVSLLATYNALQFVVEKSRERATMTTADALRHPRAVQWEPAGGSNLKNYRVGVEGGRVVVTLPLLEDDGSGALREVDASFTCAPSGQLHAPVIEAADGKTTLIHYQAQTGEPFIAQVKSADLLLDWTSLAHRKAADVAAGSIGPAYLKMAVEIRQKLPEGWDGKRPKAISHFSSARGKDDHKSGVFTGLRVLSVDLGARSFAACSVFELKDAAPAKGKLAFPVEDGRWAVHERSFLLHLPDEIPDTRGAQWRAEAMAEVRGLRRAIARYRRVYRLATLEDVSARGEELAALQTAIQESPAAYPFEQAALAVLATVAGGAPDAWQAAVEQAKRAIRHGLGIEISAWRKRTRAKSRDKALGKSMWAIEYLTEVRRLLMSWSLLADTSGRINRLDRAGRGVFASRLLAHLDGVKKDRLKTGADLVVQAARGYVRGEDGQWRQKFAPCHAVLFEDLTRYRMKTDRPRRENSLLMRWAHRSVPGEVQMQGEIYGIFTCETAAAFSSRFHAATGAPGNRCHPLAADDVANSVFRQILEMENPGVNLDALVSGELVLLAGGEIFAAARKEGVVRIHADLNAAQNLQRRFWTRHGDPVRIPCRKVIVDGVEKWLPKSMGKRLLGGMGGYGWLLPTGHETGSCRWEALTPKKWKALAGETSDDLEGGDDLEAIQDELLETTGEVTVFFRDPSGVVLPDGLWYPAKSFWGIVKAKTGAALKK